MNEKLTRIIQSELEIERLRQNSKQKHESIILEYRDKANTTISSLEDEIEKKHLEMIADVRHDVKLHVDALNQDKEKEMQTIRDMYELNKEEVKRKMIEEVFKNGNR